MLFKLPEDVDPEHLFPECRYRMKLRRSTRGREETLRAEILSCSRCRLVTWGICAPCLSACPEAASSTSLRESTGAGYNGCCRSLGVFASLVGSYLSLATLSVYSGR